MIGEVSWGNCTVYCAFVRFREKNAQLDHFGCCLSCVTPPLIFHQLISNRRLQINTKNGKNKFYYLFNPFCWVKWTNWHVIVYVGWMEKAKKKQQFNWLQLTFTLGFPSSRIHWLKINQNLLTRFHVQSIFELFKNIKCHTLKLTLFVHFKLQSHVDWRAKHVCDDFDRRVQLQTWHFLWVADFDRNFCDMKTSTKRMSVGKIGPTTAPVGSQSKHLTTRQLICAQMVVQKQLCSPFCCVLSRRFPKNCRLGKALQRCAWRHLNCTWKFHNRRKECIR